MTCRQKLRGRPAVLVLALILATLTGLVAGAQAAGPDPYSLHAQALLSDKGADVIVRVEGPGAPELLHKVQVKVRSADGTTATKNFFDVAAPNGVATLSLEGLERGDTVEVAAHLKDGPQHNLEAAAVVRRRPDLTVASIAVPADVVRTRSFDVTVSVAETGGDVGASATVSLYDGTTLLASERVSVPAAGAAPVSFRVAIAKPGDHTLRAVVGQAEPGEWDLDANAREQLLYVNHYDANGVVATDHPLATEIGVEILRNGGNAFDAAAAIQFALNVVHPHLAGIGGGSDVIVRVAKTGEILAIDARETAPAATTRTTYSGLTVAAVRPNGFAAGVPGTLRAIEHLLDSWGTMSLAETLAPAIGLAENGVPIGFSLARNIVQHQSVFQPETRAIYFDPAGQPKPEGATLVQPDLAKTFRLLAGGGADAFYSGPIAEAIVAAQQRATTPARAGKMTLADLAQYEVDVDPALSVEYRGYDVVAPGPATSGGLVLLETLGLIREFLADPSNAGYEWGYATRNSLHVLIEALRLSFADRDWWVGDEAFTDVPVAGLLNPDYLRARSTAIARETTMCNPVSAGNPTAFDAALVTPTAGSDEPGHTSHTSVIDRWGNAVVITSTLADSFGTGITVPGYGFQLNNSLTLFNLTPRSNASTGNPGANDPAGGKRPAANMTPTLILRDGEPFAATGTYGSGFIPSVVLNVVLNLLEFGKPLQEAVDAPRIWLQSSTGAAQLNFGLDHLITPLRAMGHVGPAFGGCADNMNRTPLPPLLNLGSTGSFGVDLGDFTLLGGQDRARFPEATTTIVSRP